MATTPSTTVRDEIDYPTGDGRPMAETEDHRDIMIDSIQVLNHHFADDPMVCVSGNMLMYYVPGNRWRHVSPDVFVVRGVPKRRRDYYLVWEEGRAPDLVIEVTSRSTRGEDIDDKFAIYRDQLRVAEYFLCDPLGEYLDPPLQGYRLIEGQYVPIEPVAGGRLPSAVLGLELERVGSRLRFYDPATGRFLRTAEEIRQALGESEAARQRESAARQQAEAARQRESAARQQAEAARQRESAARQQAEAARQRESAARQQAEAEVERLRRELEELRRERADGEE